MINILITGGSKGIGRAIALSFAKPGNAIFINYANDDSKAKETKAKAEKKGATVHLLKADVGNNEEIIKIMKNIKSKISHLNLLVHCAVLAEPGSIFEVSSEKWMKVIKTSSFSLIEVVRESLPILHEGSSVIALSSNGAQKAIPNYSALGIPKATIESIIKYMVLDLAPRGIRANVVSAGPLDTEAYRSVFPNDADNRLKSSANKSPSKKNITFNDVTNTVKFLASPEAQMIQGRVLFVDGGLYI